MTTVTVSSRANAALLGSCHRDVGQGPVWVPLLTWSQQRPNRWDMWQKRNKCDCRTRQLQAPEGRWPVPTVGSQGTRGKPRLLGCVGPARCLYGAVEQAVRRVSRGLWWHRGQVAVGLRAFSVEAEATAGGQVGVVGVPPRQPGEPRVSHSFFYKSLSPVSRIVAAAFPQAVLGRETLT